MSLKSKRQRLIAFILVYTMQYPRTLNSNIHHSNRREPPPFVHSNINIWTHILVATVELISLSFLNILFFNFSNKSLRFARSRRSYVNRTAFVLTNHCESYNFFCQSYFVLDVHCSKRSLFFSCSYLFPMIVHLRNLFLLSTRVAQMLLSPRC